MTRRTLLAGSLRLAAATVCASVLGCQRRSSAATPISALPQPEGEQAEGSGGGVTVYSWSDANQRGIIPMTWQPMDQTGPAMMLVKPIPGAFSGALADVVALGPNIQQSRDWMRQYFQRFHPGPKRIVLDEEASGISYWQLCGNTMPWGEQRVEVFRPVWEDEAAYQKLPDAVKQFQPVDFATSVGRGRQAIIAWEQFAADMKAEALREVVYEPAVAAFGESIAASNYDDFVYDFPVFDVNGWPRPQQIMGNWSSPSCYLWNRGLRYQNQPKPIVWNNFIDSLNAIRSCRNHSWRVAPWVSYPSFQEGATQVNVTQQRWLWGELVAHMKASGITTFLYWNPTDKCPPEENALAAKTFALGAGKIATETFSALPLNADEVLTGSQVTRFSDWEKFGDAG